jgi:hypothetical protein
MQWNRKESNERKSKATDILSVSVLLREQNLYLK